MDNENTFDISYPDEEEIRAAQLACCGRVCKECESPAAYAWRKREVDMSLLLEFAVENELTENEKFIIEDMWFNSLSLSQSARKRGISVNAVKHTSERALRKLEHVLQYVVFYQRNIVDESIVPAAVGKARMIASARNFVAEDICQRIRNLRIGQGFSLRSLSKCMGMPVKRITEIERGDIPEVDEIVSLSKFFAVTTDYLLKGESNV